MIGKKISIYVDRAEKLIQNDGAPPHFLLLNHLIRLIDVVWQI